MKPVRDFMMSALCVTALALSVQAAPLELPDGTVTANRQDSGTGTGSWFGESKTTLTINAQNVGAGEHVVVSGSITGISAPSTSWVEIGLIQKSVWDYWQTAYGGVYKSAVYSKGIYVVSWSDSGLGLSLAEDGSTTGPYGWAFTSPTVADPWDFTVTMYPTSSGNAYLDVSGKMDLNYWEEGWPVLYGTQPFAYSGDYSQCYLIAQIWSNVANATLSFVDVQADIVPEPATMGLVALGGLALLRRRRK